MRFSSLAAYVYAALFFALALLWRDPFVGDEDIPGQAVLEL